MLPRRGQQKDKVFLDRVQIGIRKHSASSSRVPPRQGGCWSSGERRNSCLQSLDDDSQEFARPSGELGKKCRDLGMEPEMMFGPSPENVEGFNCRIRQAAAAGVGQKRDGFLEDA